MNIFKLSNLQENIFLSQHTTFRIGGPARYFAVVKNQEELIGAIRAAKENNIPFYILGGGSNILASDEGFDGIVIKISNPKFQISKTDSECEMECDAGVPLGKIILETARNGFSGAEWGFGIPGTVGGAICGNAGRLGQDISRVVESVKILDENLNEKILSAQECGFSYRSSRFKKTGEVIIGVTLEFQKKKQTQIDEVFEEAKKVIKNSPPFPSAGCVFKNYIAGGAAGGSLPRSQPPTPALRFARRLSLGTEPPAAEDPLLLAHPELTERVRGGKIGVGYLIDQCGLRGRQVGGAKIWEGHANYIVNVGGAKAKDVLELIKLCKEAVKERYGINLEEEIRIINH